MLGLCTNTLKPFLFLNFVGPEIWEALFARDPMFFSNLERSPNASALMAADLVMSRRRSVLRKCDTESK